MIIISPYAQKLRNEKTNPKNYPYWPELIKLIDQPVVQVGVKGEQQLTDDFRPNLPLTELAELVHQADTWISVDSFFQHFCWDLKKYGIVIWAQSDPFIFGHPENINLLKDRKYLRKEQFWLWEQCEYKQECFVKPKEIVKHIDQFVKR
jgi:ADP-heptose:LPS heptosyltransferase